MDDNTPPLPPIDASAPPGNDVGNDGENDTSTTPPTPENIKAPKMPVPPKETSPAPTQPIPTPLPTINPEQKPAEELPTPKDTPLKTPTASQIPSPPTPPQPPTEAGDETSETSSQPGDKTPVIDTPTKEDMPVEDSFPGQPLPASKVEDLEKKAEKLIADDGGVKHREVKVLGKPKTSKIKNLVTVMALVLVGAGAFFGQQALKDTTDNRSQAVGQGGGSCTAAQYRELDRECLKTENAGKYVETSDKGCSKICAGGACTAGDTKTGDARCNCGTNGWIFGTQQLKCNSTGTAWYQTSNNCSDRCEEEFPKEKEKEGNKCNCGSWANACGKNCVFPSGEISRGQEKADKTCKTQILVCTVATGKTTIERFDKNHKCWGKQSECKNPVLTPNCGPDPTPTPPPEEPSLSCKKINPSLSDVNLGDSINFNCNAETKNGASIDHYEFQYRRNANAWKALEETTKGSGKSSPIKIAKSGAYAVRCRACQTSSGKCTAYQKAE